MRKSIVVPLAHCPYCGKTFDRAANTTGDEAPKDGDVSMCFGCGEWLIFDATLTMRKPTEDELLNIGLDKDCQRVRRAWALATARS